MSKEKLFQAVYAFVLGDHPRNTIFAFNYVNVRHILSFLKGQIKHLAGRKYVIADLGAGSSPYYFLFEPIAESYIAVDRQDSLPQHEARPITQIHADASATGIAPESVDIILCNQLLEHVISPDLVIKESFRLLKPGGYFFGSVPHASPIHLEPYDYWRFTELGVRALFEQEGFFIKQVEGNGGVHQCAALLILMDWMMSRRVEGKGQFFSTRRALFLSPLVALINVSAIILDKIIVNKNRTPANLCWIACKQAM